jgi:site-specific DNA-methyltransferase (adenine-specific)
MGWIVWYKKNTGNFADFEMAWTSYNKASRLYEYLWNGLSREGSRELELVKRVHPTQKPVGLNMQILQNYDCNIIYDGFLGSGSTMVAAHQLKRKCYGMELECKYVEVIVQRMIKLDKTLTIKRNGIDETQKWLDKLV